MITKKTHYYAHQPYPVVPEMERSADWRYQLMEFSQRELLIEVRSMERLLLIEWLAWNDVHGIYLDEDCRAEGYPPLTKEHAEMCVYTVIMRETKDWDGYMGDEYVKDVEL